MAMKHPWGGVIYHDFRVDQNHIDGGVLFGKAHEFGQEEIKTVDGMSPEIPISLPAKFPLCLDTTAVVVVARNDIDRNSVSRHQASVTREIDRSLKGFFGIRWPPDSVFVEIVAKKEDEAGDVPLDHRSGNPAGHGFCANVPRTEIPYGCEFDANIFFRNFRRSLQTGTNIDGGLGGAGE